MKKSDIEKNDIESSLEQLEGIIQSIRSSQTSLDEALLLYSDGARIAAECRRLLDSAKLKIEECSEGSV